MARRRTSRRSSRRRRSRDGGGDWKWYVAIAACILLVAGIGLISSRLKAAGQIDEATLCHRGGPLNTTVVLLDLTDPLNRTQQARLENIIDQEISRSTVDTMIVFGIVSEFPEKWGAKFAKCKPETGETANALYENPILIAERYDREFLKPVGDTLSSLLTAEPENQSPIMEALQSLLADAPDFAEARGNRKLLIASDMLQHSDSLSFYRGQGWDFFQDSKGADRLASNLVGVDVEIFRIPRSGSNIPPSDIVEGFWTRYFDRQGSRPPKARSLGDL
jgi:hypothetical protein